MLRCEAESKSPVSKAIAVFASDVFSRVNLHQTMSVKGQGTREVV